MVELVRFPGEAAKRHQLRMLGRARLLLVEGGADPPTVVDEDEDWIRSPADPRDVRARRAALARRTAGGPSGRPSLDDDGLIRYGDHWVPLPPIEARLAAALLDRFGAVVSRDTLIAKGWPGASPGRNVLDVHMLRLRRRVGDVNLAIRTVRSRGYVLETRSKSPVSV